MIQQDTDRDRHHDTAGHRDRQTDTMIQQDTDRHHDTAGHRQRQTP